MSRTIRFHQFGPAEVLKVEEQPVASPAPGEVQVRVQAIGVSWYDVLWRQNLASTQARLPAGLGYEMAGVVTALGEGVDDLHVGDKVASFPAADANQHPVYGESIVMPRLALTRYPDVLTPVEASVHYTPYLVAYLPTSIWRVSRLGKPCWSPMPVIVPGLRSYSWARRWTYVSSPRPRLRMRVSICCRWAPTRWSSPKSRTC